jgi:hypothetical protein
MAITACASRPLAVIHRLDADSNAKLSKEEFKDMWNRWMLDQMDTFIFAFIDTDDNISISEEEFCNDDVELWAVCIACAVLLLLWLYCLPGEEEGREEGREETATRAATSASSATRPSMTGPWPQPQVSTQSLPLWTLTPCGGCLSGSNGAKLESLRTATLWLRRMSVRIRNG